MRATPYRFWHKTTRQLCPVREIEWDATGTLPFRRATIDITHPNGWQTMECCSSRDGVLMAATDIQDRYSVEIFEGDILNVRGRGAWGEPALVIRDTRHRGFAYVFHGHVADPIVLRSGDDFEVVGNIHEHPALLG